MKHTASTHVLLSEKFASDPAARGWKAEVPANEPSTAQWLPSADRPDAGCIAAASGAWVGPLFPVEPFQYYQLRFRSKAEGKTYWMADFFDAEGRKDPADFYSCFEASPGWTEQTFCLRARDTSRQAYLAFRAMGGKTFSVTDVSLRPVSHAEVAQWAHTVYAGVPSVTEEPSPDRWAYIPATVARLRAGQPLKIVMLGDSIINDTANSAFETLVERMYPGASIRIVLSIRGSTGCAYYKQDAVLKPLVLDHAPDLLMIGGISNTDKDAVKEVVRKVRAQSAADIVIMTPPVGRVNPFKYPDWKPGVALDGTDYKSRLFQAATEEKVEFLDIESQWGRYILQAGKPWEFFTRDELHASEQGRQVIGRILEAYFAPKK